MFENFKAYTDDYKVTVDWASAAYFVIFNEAGFEEAIQWLTNTGNYDETYLIKNRESHYYVYNNDRGMYEPIDDVPDELITEFNHYCPKEKKNTNETSQKFKIKIQLVNGITIEPNLYSNDFHEIADVIQELSCEKLFAGQIKSIKIE